MGTYIEVDGNNFRELSTRPREDEQTNRGVLKWFTRSVLKTDDRETDPGVRIRPPLQLPFSITVVRLFLVQFVDVQILEGQLYHFKNKLWKKKKKSYIVSIADCPLLALI